MTQETPKGAALLFKKRKFNDQWDEEEGLEAFTPEGLDFVPGEDRYFE